MGLTGVGINSILGLTGVGINYHEVDRSGN